MLMQTLKQCFVKEGSLGCDRWVGGGLGEGWEGVWVFLREKKTCKICNIMM